MTRYRLTLSSLLLLYTVSPSWSEDIASPDIAAPSPFETQVSTFTYRAAPSLFIKRTAATLDWPQEKLEKLERRGFGRTEMITLILMARQKDKKWDDWIKEREKGAALRDMASKEGLDYNDLFRQAQTVKRGIDADLADEPQVIESTATLTSGTTIQTGAGEAKP